MVSPLHGVPEGQPSLLAYRPLAAQPPSRCSWSSNPDGLTPDPVLHSRRRPGWRVSGGANLRPDGCRYARLRPGDSRCATWRPLLILLGAIILSACGGGGKEEEAAKEKAPEAAATAAATPEEGAAEITSAPAEAFAKLAELPHEHALHPGGHRYRNAGGSGAGPRRGFRSAGSQSDPRQRPPRRTSSSKRSPSPSAARPG